MNLLHDRQLTLARRNKGQGSLRLGVDAEGVWFEFEAPRCDIGDRALEMVRRGDYSGCSFEFYAQDYDVEERGKDDLVIRHRKFRALSSLTIGMDPAYKQTSVNARELLDHHHVETEEEKQQREAEAEAQRKGEEETMAAEAKAAAERSYNYRRRKLSLNY
jgi:HK97 family phage prohead protease